MRIFQTLLNKYAKEIEDVPAIVNRLKLVKGDLKQCEIEKLMASKIPQDYILELECMDNKDGVVYPCNAYFLCEIPRKNMKDDGEFKAVKITGNKLGEVYSLSTKQSEFNPDLIRASLWDGERVYRGWFNATDGNIYIPHKCKTLNELRVAVAKSNNDKASYYSKKGDLNL